MTIAEKNTKTPKAAIELNIGQTLSTGTLGGKTFDAIPGGDVSIYTTEPFEQKTADEAAPASATDIEIDVRKDSRGVAAHGVKIELNPEGIPVISLEKGKKLSVEPTFSNDTAAAEADGVALNVTEERIRVTLPGGEVFDITPDGNATTYGDSVQRKTADATPLNAEEYQRVTIRDRFNAVAMNNSSIELTDGALAIATDGISKAKPPAVTVNAASETKTALKIGDPVPEKNGWIYMGKSPKTGEDFFAAPEDSGVMSLRKAKKVIKALQKNGIDARLPVSGELFRMYNEKSSLGKLDEAGVLSKSGLYQSSARPVTHDFKYGCIYHGSLFKKHSIRLVCS